MVTEAQKQMLKEEAKHVLTMGEARVEQLVEELFEARSEITRAYIEISSWTQRWQEQLRMTEEITSRLRKALQELQSFKKSMAATKATNIPANSLENE